MAKNIRTIVLIFIGVISIWLSMKCFSYKEMNYEVKSMYGGDAFTGIQNAGAQTSENISDLAKIVQFGFGSVLLIAGLGFLGVGLTTPMAKRNLEVGEKLTHDSSENTEYKEETTVDNQ